MNRPVELWEHTLFYHFDDFFTTFIWPEACMMMINQGRAPNQWEKHSIHAELLWQTRLQAVHQAYVDNGAFGLEADWLAEQTMAMTPPLWM